jgi:hypothetical protein
MTTAIVPARVAQILPLEVFSIERGGRNTVNSANGRIASDIELIELDEELGIARYELRLANDSPSLLTCYAYAVRGKAGDRPVTCASIAVMPHSGVAVTFELPLPFIGTYDRITVEMHGDGVDVSSDTIPPGRNEKLLVRRAGTIVAAILATTMLAVLGIAQPQIIAINAPSEALGGSTLRLTYEARGLGQVTYGLVGTDGTVIGSGVTHPGIGTVGIKLPAVPASRTYLARVESHNIFGGDTKTAVVRDLATPVPVILHLVAHPANITNLSVDRSMVHSGDDIVVHYGFNADRGTLRLMDDADTVWAATNVSEPGNSKMHAPHVDHEENLRLALHVDRGATSADSQVGVVIAPATPKPETFRQITGAPVEISSQPIKSGDTIPFRVTRSVSDLHISLQDSMGLEVESFNVDGNQGALHAPQHVSNTKYTVVITFADRSGQETVVAPLIIVNQE